MDIDGVLNFITRLAWVIFIVFAIVFFVLTVRRRGIGTAIGRLFSFRLLLPLLVVLSLSTLSASLVFILPQEIGVVVSIMAPRGFRDWPLRSGLHWIIPFAEKAVTYPIYWQTYTMSSKPLDVREEWRGSDSIAARTEDGQEVFIDCSVILRIDPEQAVRVHIDWQDRYIQDLVRPVTRGIVRTRVSQYKVDEVNSSKRLNLEAELDREMRMNLEDKGFILDRFVLRNITFSPEYAAAVEQKQVAFQGMTRKEYEAEQIRKYAAGEAQAIVIKAEAGAQAVVIQAKAGAEARVIQAKAEAEALQLIANVLAQNRDLLTYEYISKLSPGIKVMLVPTNAPFILPLPSLGLTGTESFTSTPIEASLPAPTFTETLSPTLAIPAETPTPTPSP